MGKTDTHEFGVHGANHNYFNTQWSPQSGQVAAHDGVGHPKHQPGKYTDAYAPTVDLMINARSVPVLEGRTHPAAGTVTVEVKATVRR